MQYEIVLMSRFMKQKHTKKLMIETLNHGGRRINYVNENCTP